MLFHRSTRRWMLLLVMALPTLLLPRVGESAPLVGAYYYPWYGSFAGGHAWTDTLRAKLSPPQPPALGFYSSRDSAVIAGQIDQSHRGNICFWAVSWWGPGSADDVTTREYILGGPRAGELKYAVHYESTGRLGLGADPSFANLVPDFQYLAEHYFSNANYLRVNGRPVVFIYLTRVYFNTAAGREVVAKLRQTMTSQFGVDLYLVGDDVFPGQTNTERARLWDAITDFDVYGSGLAAHGATRAGVTALAREFQSARQLAKAAHVGFVPSVSPGFNDTAVRSGHVAAPRYLTDEVGAAEGALFSAELNEAALPNLDAAVDNMLMVSTFNEWHEDTQVEATIAAEATTVDSSAQARYAQGGSYRGYGNLYLDLLRAATSPAGE